jgi:hypothetical protein
MLIGFVQRTGDERIGSVQAALSCGTASGFCKSKVLRVALAATQQQAASDAG